MLKELRGMPVGVAAFEAVGTVTARDYAQVFRTAGRSFATNRLSDAAALSIRTEVPADHARGVVGRHPAWDGLLAAARWLRGRERRRVDSDANAPHRIVDAVSCPGVSQRRTR